ncbi:MAG: Nucleoside hydrolase [Rhodospirillales bacterium]|nr:Nucleoside hydrolase [Rhodospirillales bacterium]
MKKVIFDTDPGIDDAMALLFLKKAPDVEIVGVTTCFGNGTIETTTRNALHLCDIFGIDAPVAKGASVALHGRADPPADHVHGNNCLGDVTLPVEPMKAAHYLPADAFIVDMVRCYPHQITIVAVARMTNLALALRRDPGIAPLVKDIIVMGGAFGFHGHSGNVSPVAEANISGDPLAADEVFGADWPVTIVGLDVTEKTVMPTELIDRIAEHGDATGKFIGNISRFYLDFHRDTEGMDGMFLHDSSAVAYLMDPSLFTTRRGPVRVVCDGIAVGQTIQKSDRKRITPAAWQNRPSQTICTDVDSQRLLDLHYEVVIARS